VAFEGPFGAKSQAVGKLCNAWLEYRIVESREGKKEKGGRQQFRSAEHTIQDLQVSSEASNRHTPAEGGEGEKHRICVLFPWENERKKKKKKNVEWVWARIRERQGGEGRKMGCSERH